MQTIYLAGGCFWSIQKFFDQFEGVVETETGYANGHGDNPSYDDVCSGSGHAETVRVVYDENAITLAELLQFYFIIIDPLSVNRQGNDAGVQYRTGIYYEGERPSDIDTVMKEEEAKAGQRLAVETGPLMNFYPAETYHQKYLDAHPLGYCHIPRPLMELGNKGRTRSARTEGGCMFRKFDKERFRWDGAEPHVYKENPGVFKDATKTILFDNEGDLPVQFRYFEIQRGGFSSLEHHQHMHVVLIARGWGHMLLGKEIKAIGQGDFLTIAPWEFHQFRADAGEILGFFCLVRSERDVPVYPTKEEMDEFRAYPAIAAFLGEEK